MKLAAWVFLALALFIFGLGSYFYCGIRKEALSSLYSIVFPELVNRAIQLERTGEMRIPRINGFSKIEEFPEQMQHAHHVLWEVSNGSRDVDCNLDIKMPRVDTFKISPSLGTMLSYRPMRYLVIFEEPPPDLQPFLDAPIASPLLGPIESMDPHLSEDTAQLLSNFERLLLVHEDGIDWQARVCETFSFIIFSGK